MRETIVIVDGVGEIGFNIDDGAQFLGLSQPCFIHARLPHDDGNVGQMLFNHCIGHAFAFVNHQLTQAFEFAAGGPIENKVKGSGQGIN